MTRLEYRQQKIQQKRKQTPFREFVKEICSWQPMTFYKWSWPLARYPETERIGTIVDAATFVDTIDISLWAGWPTDLSLPFLTQLTQLQAQTAMPAVRHFYPTENASYADTVWYVKNGYLSHLSFFAENIFYSFYVAGESRNIYNSFLVIDGSESVYMSKGIIRSHTVFYTKHAYNCSDIWFSSNLTGCKECLFCHDLVNASYCLDNEELEKDTYYKKKAEILTRKQKFLEYYKNISSAGMNIASENVEGTFIMHSRDIQQSSYVYQVHTGRNLLMTGNFTGKEGILERMYDNFTTWLNAYDIYGGMWCSPGNHCYCCKNSGDVSNIYYCSFLMNCSYCLGCIGLKNKSYCILNKQYEKEGWFEEVDRIFEAMEQDDTLWSFLPPSMNPFYFNDTAAYLIDDSFSKEEVEKEWFLRREEEVKVDIPDGMEVVKTSELGEYEGWKQTPLASGHSPLSGGPNEKAPLIRGGGSSEARDGGVWKTRYIDPSILNKVIQDEEGNVYRIVKMEYDFLMKHGLPLPRLHRLDRLKMNFKIS